MKLIRVPIFWQLISNCVSTMIQRRTPPGPPDLGSTSKSLTRNSRREDNSPSHGARGSLSKVSNSPSNSLDEQVFCSLHDHAVENCNIIKLNIECANASPAAANNVRVGVPRANWLLPDWKLNTGARTDIPA
ncbi:unnamed protein product [Trichogramma brassicae]|uniref:Uncharacterized protein n=1 Tax=Trichogramma brassicae TaxID=86971 RepID=A0A6H5IIU7_9HYME|nr:unnamed protein product [Trichogramma brassicae]